MFVVGLLKKIQGPSDGHLTTTWLSPVNNDIRKEIFELFHEAQNVRSVASPRPTAGAAAGQIWVPPPLTKPTNFQLPSCPQKQLLPPPPPTSPTAFALNIFGQPVQNVINPQRQPPPAPQINNDDAPALHKIKINDIDRCHRFLLEHYAKIADKSPHVPNNWMLKGDPHQTVIATRDSPTVEAGGLIADYYTMSAKNF